MENPTKLDIEQLLHPARAFRHPKDVQRGRECRLTSLSKFKREVFTYVFKPDIFGRSQGRSGQINKWPGIAFTFWMPGQAV